MRARGFSLLEVLIALMILSIGAASVLALFAGAATTHKRSLDRTQAALVAERVIAEVQARYTVGMTAEMVRERMEKEVARLFGDYRWDLLLVHPAELEPDAAASARRDGADGEEDGERAKAWAPHELFVRVDVRWKRSAQERAERYETILLPRNEPGAESLDERRTRGSGLLPAR